MAYPKVARCRHCGAKIQFAKRADNGRVIPIDPIQVDRHKDPLADMAWYSDPVTDEDMVRKITPQEPVDPDPGVERHVRRHFVSCTSPVTFPASRVRPEAAQKAVS